MKVLYTREQLQQWRDDVEASGSPTAAVMTMGALHAGHGELVRVAKEQLPDDGELIVTIFVNPLQFGANEDLDKYPRTVESDLALVESLGATAAFVPTEDVMYPNGRPATIVDPGPLGKLLEGQARPEHFAGVLTVVAKFLNLLGVDAAYFGEKDYQQLTLIKQMVNDLDLPVRIEPVPTVRDPDGLAMSSRKRYLSAAARQRALAIPAAIQAGRQAAATGANAQEIEHVAMACLEAVPDDSEVAAIPVDIQYVVVRGTDLGEPPKRGEARLILTVVVDGTRLLDNARVDLSAAAGKEPG